MTLSPSLYDDVFYYPCPSCGEKHKKTGRWFAIVARYHCLNCNTEIFLSYPQKIEIFNAHSILKDKGMI